MDTTALTIEHRAGDFRLTLSLGLDRGWTALFGPSGSGKTTLLECVAGLRRPQRGRIVVEGAVVFDAEAGIDAPPRARRVGYVSQEGHLFPHLTVRQNLAFGQPREAVATSALDEVAAMLEVDDLLERLPAQLSGGQRQRVALGRALLSKPRLLLLDEPLSSLDARLQGRVMASFARVRKELAVPCLYVTHSVNEVLHLADRVVMLSDGSITGFGPPSAVLASVGCSETLERHAEGLENLLELRVRGHEPDDGTTALDLGEGQVLRIPLVDAPLLTRLRVAFRADDVMMALGHPEALSAQNVLRARVVEIVTQPHAHYVRCAFDARTSVWSHITPAALRRMELREGTEVTLILKSHAVRAR